MHLFPRFCRPVRHGPKTGSNAFPASSVSEKSKLRLCSICWSQSFRLSFYCSRDTKRTSSVIDFSVFFCV